MNRETTPLNLLRPNRFGTSEDSHGFALNIAPDLTAFSTFTACGLPEVAMTSLAEMAAAMDRPAPTEDAV